MQEKSGAASAGQEPSTSANPMPRLLLVDDHEDLANATAEFLSDAGLEVRIASTGGEALKAAIAFRPHIVVCDLHLPDLSGLEVAQAMRQNPATRDALFVICTGLSEEDIRAFQWDGSNNDVHLYVSKPLTTEKIDKILAAFTSMRKPRVPPQ